MSRRQFRFQDFEIWRRAAEVSALLFALADGLEGQRKFRFAEQLRAATLSITNNIAEGSGSVSDADFAHFLNMSRRSVFEVANMLLLFSRQGYVKTDLVGPLLDKLEEQSRMTLAFMRNLKG
ncbi:MAG TPA: four helix bundle protein [Planctomycetaceae bacterium]|nr:four helix bundle protein [Planctomycetaceae bacterium]